MAIAVVCLCAGLCTPVAGAAAKPRLHVSYPTIAVAGRIVPISGTVAGTGATGARVQLQERVGKRWRTRGSLHRVAARRFRVNYLPTARTTAVTLRLRLRRGGRTLAASVRRVRLSQRPAGAKKPVDVPVPSQVASIPSPGTAGNVTVHGATSARAGDFLAIGIGPASPDGFLGLITGVRKARGDTVFSTTPTTLIDAVPQGKIDQQVTQNAPFDSFTPRSTSRPRTLGCGAQGEVSLTIDPPSLSRSIDFKANWRLIGGLQSASLSATVTLSAGAHAAAAAAVSCALDERSIAEFKGRPVQFQVGPVPVVLTPNAAIFVDASAKADAKISTGLTAAISATSGVQWTKRDGVSPISRFDKTFNFDPPALEAGGSLSTNLTPKVNVLLYGVAGPQIAFKAGLDLQADITKVPWWGLTAPVDLTAELVIPVLKLSTPKLHVYQDRFGLAIATTPAPAPPAPPAPLPNSSLPRHIAGYTTTPDLQCGLFTQEDLRDEFFGGSFGNDACGTFVAIDGLLYGPSVIPAGSGLGVVEPWTPVSQTFDGTGTQADPFTTVTRVAAAFSGIELTETDTWVDGGNVVNSRFVITSEAGDARPVRLYRAADCYVGDSDVGFGSYIPASQTVGCLRDNFNGTQTELRLSPQTPGATVLEGGFNEVWQAVATQGPLANACRCGENIDNGIAASWGRNLIGATPTVFDSRFEFVIP